MGKAKHVGRTPDFRCRRQRRAKCDRCAPPYLHQIVLTGRTRDRKGERLSREYECACGYVGYSSHIDLERAATGGHWEYGPMVWVPDESAD